MTDSPLLKTSEVAERLNISRDNVLGLIRAGRLPAVVMGPKTIRVLESELEKFLQEAARK